MEAKLEAGRHRLGREMRGEEERLQILIDDFLKVRDIDKKFARRARQLSTVGHLSCRFRDSSPGSIIRSRHTGNARIDFFRLKSSRYFRIMSAFLAKPPVCLMRREVRLS